MNIKRVYLTIGTGLALSFFLAGIPSAAMSPGVSGGFNELRNVDVEADTVVSDTCVRTRKNIVSLDLLILFPALGYSRIVPLTDNTGLVFYSSITPYFDFVIDVGGAVTLGKTHHFFEPGVGYLLFADSFYVKGGYRYQSKRGFVFRIAPGFNVTEKVPWFTASFGYAF
jgi:hypothetical protein